MELTLKIARLTLAVWADKTTACNRVVRSRRFPDNLRRHHSRHVLLPTEMTRAPTAKAAYTATTAIIMISQSAIPHLLPASHSSLPWPVCKMVDSAAKCAGKSERDVPPEGSTQLFGVAVGYFDKTGLDNAPGPFLRRSHLFPACPMRGGFGKSAPKLDSDSSSQGLVCRTRRPRPPSCSGSPVRSIIRLSEEAGEALEIRTII